MNSYSPAIAVPDVPFESLLLERVRPSYAAVAEELRKLEVLDELPPPVEVSPTDPAGLWVQRIPDVAGRGELDAGFEYFLKGCAIYTQIVKPAFHAGVEAMVRVAGERVMSGHGLPEIDEVLVGSFNTVLNTLFMAGEELVYRSFIAFATGAYYLLSYTADRVVRHGEWTPILWTQTLTTHWAALSYVPD